MHTRFVAALAAAALFACGPSDPPRVPADATLLYDVDFSAPEHTVGQLPATVPDGEVQTFPSRIPSRIFFGNPKVVAKRCGLEQQPLQLSAKSGAEGIEGIEILLDQRHAHYRVELDVCLTLMGAPPLQSQKMQFAVFLDFAEAYALAFMAGGDIGVVDPNLPETVENPRLVARYEPNKPMRLALDADYDAQRWQVAIDGKQIYDGELQMTIPRAVRVVIRGHQQNVAAIDNLLIWGQRPLVPASDVAPIKSGEEP